MNKSSKMYEKSNLLTDIITRAAIWSYLFNAYVYTNLPDKSLVYHLACSSAIGITAPIACTSPINPRVSGFSRCGRNVYLYVLIAWLPL